MKKLLILGAGGHGLVCREAALTRKFYSKIDFLDDNYFGAVGKISNLSEYVKSYSDFFVGIGNNKLRQELLKKLSELGCFIPTFIHPSAYVSPSSKIGEGTIIGPMAIINSNVEIGAGCIISAGVIIDHNAKIGDFAHLDVGTICKSGGAVLPLEKTEAGKIIIGY